MYGAKFSLNNNHAVSWNILFCRVFFFVFETTGIVKFSANSEFQKNIKSFYDSTMLSYKS